MSGRPRRVPTSQSSRIRASTVDVALRAIAGVVWWKLASVRLAMLASSRYLIGFIWLVTLTVWPSLDHLIRPLQERLGDRQAEGLGGLEVDDQLELGRLFDGKIAGLGSFEDLVHVGRGTPELVRNVRPIGHEAPGLRKLP